MSHAFPLCELPPEKTIDVWVVGLDTATDPGDLDGILSAEERKRAASYLLARDARRFKLCRATLRVAVAWYLRQSPEGVVLLSNPRGKPCLSQAGKLHFNVAHSASLATIAFTTVGEVGIDVEAIRCDISAMAIASANFTKKEAALVASGGTRQQQAVTFLRLWTRKEAVLKAAGWGISIGLDAVDVSEEPENLAWLAGAPGQTAKSCWMVRDWEPVEGFVGAIAAPAGNWTVRRWTFRAEDVISRLAESFS